MPKKKIQFHQTNILVGLPKYLETENNFTAFVKV